MEQVIAKIENEDEKKGALAFLMRYLGMGLAAMGAVILLIEGSRNVDSIGRFFAFSSIISICAGLGFYLSVRRSDHRNARLLMGVFLGCIPVFWSQLGAVIYSGIYGIATQMAPAFQMPAASGVSMFAGLSIAIGLIIPLTAILARIFVPRISLPYTTVMVVAGIFLCLPFRSGDLAELMLLLAGFGVLYAERSYFSKDEHLQTGEMRFARAVLLAVPFILGCRASFYQSAPAVLAVNALGFAGFAYWIHTFFDKATQRSGRFVSDICVALSLGILASYAAPYVGRAEVYTLSYLLPGIFMFLRSDSREKSTCWTAVAFWLVILGAGHGRNMPGIMAEVAAIVVPLVCVIESYRRRHLWHLGMSIFMLIVDLYATILQMMEMVVEYRWSIFMVSGIALIFSASYVEGGIRKIKGHWHRRTA